MAIRNSLGSGGLLGTLGEIARELPLVFPVHPRTRKRLADAGITLDPKLFSLVDPQGYLDFMKLTANAN